MLAKIDVMPEIVMASESKVNQRLLWLGLLTGPLAYALYVGSSYLLLQGVCRIEMLQMDAGGLSLCAVLLLILTLLSSLITLLTGLTNFRRLRRHLSANHPAPTPKLPAPVCVGVLLTIFFTGAILLTGIPLFVLQSCGWL